ncbi:sigma-54 interaction domain-containing protein [Bacillus thermotolerans]|uniref:sigma-54 interaction domain-containing protein n=1 Tax=Bacillus thermotolerans TaxID=1221996 RepID=UPI000588F3A0|nr:sigma 54-interacting transcriptional regulator [Bacillus thermotolerans]KKB40525.1 Response regulator of zinc sigma-54-dependent two-component system [Bacillus thermotolerans]
MEMANEDVFRILDAVHDGFYITDANGTTVWVSKTSCEMLNKTREELIGRNVWDLEKEGLFSPSVNRLVLQKKENISVIQTIKGHHQKWLVSGYIVEDESGGIKWVITHGRSITQDLLSTTQHAEVESILNRYVQELRHLQLKEEKKEKTHQLIGDTPAFKKLIEQSEKIALSDASVLLTGETGSGKNVLASYIHKLSERHGGPFIQVNCGAIPESLFESELFGYKKGAFTGASGKGKIGLVKVAEGGTLFLDEIGELPLHLQVKILQLIQDKTYLPIGEVYLHSADVRIIAATNRNLLELVEKNQFRADLFYRLNVLSMNIPALRERPDDIFRLIQHYMDMYNEKYKTHKTLSREALNALQAYSWPGNIRELANTVERIMIMSDQDQIEREDLPESIQASNKHSSFIQPAAKQNLPLREYLDEVEKEFILHKLKQAKTTREAAKSAGIPQSTLMRKIQKHGLNK